jgi:hypothetical protein
MKDAYSSEARNSYKKALMILLRLREKVRLLAVLALSIILIKVRAKSTP